MPDDLAQLVDDLAHLHRALGATYDLDRAYTRSTPAALVGAALVPTAPPSDGRRGVPGSRPPVDLEALAAQEGIDRAVMALFTDIWAVLGFPPRLVGPRRALRALPRFVDALPEDHAYRRRVPAVLEALRARARYVLDPDRRFLVLGDCPARFDEPLDVVTRDGPVAGDLGCWTFDPLATAQRDDDVAVVRRSRLVMPRDQPGADIRCRTCGWTCTARDRAADLVLAQGLDMLVSLREASAFLAVADGTLWDWASRGVIVSLEKGRRRRYGLAAVARVVVERRPAAS